MEFRPKAKKLIRQMAYAPMTFWYAAIILVSSLGLLCVSSCRGLGGEGFGSTLRLGNCLFQLSCYRGAVGFVAWGRGVGAPYGLHFQRGSRLSRYRSGLRFNALGFGFGFSPFTSRGSDVITPPHFGVTIPLWFTSAAAFGLMLLNRHLRHRIAPEAVPGEGGSDSIDVERWLLTCSVCFALAQVGWFCSHFVRKIDALEIPLAAPLLPLMLLLDPRDTRASQSDWVLYAFLFWAALIGFSLILSRRRVHPIIAGAILLALACAFGSLLAFMV